MRLVLPSLLLCGAFFVSNEASAKVNVVATVPDLAALTAEVGGDLVSITTLSLATQDPHFVDAKPSLVVKLNKAHLLVAVGLDLEVGWLPALQTAARNAAINTGGKGFLDCSTAVKVIEIPSAAVDRSAGDIHPQGNPHYLHDPRQARRCAQAIAGKLAQLDPDHAKTYAANAERFGKALDKAIKGWEGRLAGLKGTPVIVYHRSWNYFTAWVGLDEIAELEPKPGVPPTPRHVADVLKLARSKGAKLVLQESFYPDKTGRLVAKKLDGKVVVLPSGTDVGAGESYIEHIGHIVDAVVDARADAPAEAAK
jgi:zinc/manganese transport system substrate-binding protein